MVTLVLGHGLELATVLVYLGTRQPATILPDPEVLVGVASPTSDACLAFFNRDRDIAIIPVVVETDSN